MHFSAIDSHCHLQLAAYDADREALIEKCRVSGIGVIVVGTNKGTSAAAVTLAQAHPAGVWASIAVHPGHVHAPHHDPQEVALPPTEEFFDEEFFSRISASEKVVAIGETGLDYYRLSETAGQPIAAIKERQKENFLQHIVFAKRKGLPLIMHVRDGGDGRAYADALEILRREYGAKVPGVMHCFGGSAAEAEACLALGLHLGIGGIVTFPPRKGQMANPLAAIVRTMPLDRLLLETDAPYISPIPKRGERNEPANVLIIAQKVAELRGMPVEDIQRESAENAFRLFNLA
jgi:TatD DNase family protein